MPPKRKRGGAADSGGIRPSPHRPEQTNLGQHDQNHNYGHADTGSDASSTRGGRSASGGRGGGIVGAGRIGGDRSNSRRSERFGSQGPPQDGSPAPQSNGAPSASKTPSVATSPVVVARPLPRNGTPATPAEPPAPPPPTRPSLPPVYSILTDDIVATWTTGTGSQEIVEAGVKARTDEDEVTLSTLFQEILRSVVDRRLAPADLGTAVKQIIGDDNGTAAAFSPAIVFLDTVSIFVEVEESASVAANLPLLRVFMSSTSVPPPLMRQILDHELLVRLELLRETFPRLTIRFSTNLLYRQQSYNLLREETEGFSKLVTELYNNAVAQQDPSFDVARATFEKVKGLIGTFDLDVGRVLDTTLDVFAATIIKQFKFFVKFLRISSWWPRDHPGHPRNSFFCGLPRWAQPELAAHLAAIASSATADEEDNEESAIVAEERRKRDVAFWDIARKVHLHAFYQLGGREVADPRLQKLVEAATSNGKADDADGMLLGDDDDDKKLDDAADMDANKAGADVNIETADISNFSEDELQWIKTTKTMPPQGNRVAAQILGFKLRFYSSNARNADDILPANLLYLAALLIKIGFISFCDLYPHLWPGDEDMEDVRRRRLEEIAKKEESERFGSADAALLATVLEDDDPPAAPALELSKPAAGADGAKSDAAAGAAATDPPAEAPPALPEPMDTKLQILEQLLLIGAIPEALFILGRHPWLIELYSDTLLPLIHRILLQSLHKVAAEARPVPAPAADAPPKKIAEYDQSGTIKGFVKRGVLTIRRPFRWPYADKLDVADGQPYRYYFDEWLDNVPVCQTVDDVFTLCDSFLGVSGPSIGQEPELVISLAAIGAKDLHDDPSSANRQRWYDLLQRLLVPALSLVPANPACVDAVWQLLRTYPLRQRYELYAEWFEGSISRQPVMQKAFARTKREALRIMRRISRENSSLMGRSLAKAALTSPAIVFKVALGELEAYDNLIDVFVTCARYFTDLGYDVLVWSLMGSIGGRRRSRHNASSVLVASKWLQALSRFAGLVFAAYPNMDVKPVVQYVARRLSAAGDPGDLIILRDLIVSMGGLTSDPDWIESKIQGMTGGPALRRLTLLATGDMRDDADKSAKGIAQRQSAQRLVKTLVDTGLVGRLLINIAQHHQAAIYAPAAKQSHVKYLSTLVDDSQEILAQYLDLLRNVLTLDQFNALVPAIPELMKEFGLEASLAFMIGRPGLDFHAAMAALPVPKMPSTDDAAVAKAEAPVSEDVAMKNGDDAQKDEETNGVKPETNGADMEVDTPAETAPPAPSMGALQPLVASIADTLSERVLKRISPEFFVTFWTLQQGDIVVPRARYSAESDRLRKESTALKNARPVQGSSENPRVAMMRRNEEAEARLKERHVIAEEELSLVTRNRDTKKHLLVHAQTWFTNNGSSTVTTASASALADILLEQCLIPRILLSVADAEYAFRFVRFLHENRVPHFQLATFYQRLFSTNRLRDLIFTSTVREAERVGRFLKLILDDLARWHGDKNAYEREGLGQTKNGKRSYLGFIKNTKAAKPAVVAAEKNGDDKENKDAAEAKDGKDSESKPAAAPGPTYIEHTEFRDLLYGWHKNLNMALKDCLENLEWTHIRNAINVLKAVMDVFPAVDFMGRQFADQLKRIAERESANNNTSPEASPRIDLSVTALAIYSKLLRRKSEWVMVQAFRSNVSSKPTGDKSKDTEKGLRPDAPEFRPQRLGGADAEDGELKDAGANALNGAKRAPSAAPSSSSATGGVGSGGMNNKPSTPRPGAAHLHGNHTPNSARGGDGHSQLPKNPSALTSSLPHSHSLPNRPDFSVGGRFAQGDRFGQVRNQDRRDAPSPRGPSAMQHADNNSNANANNMNVSINTRNNSLQPPQQPPHQQLTQQQKAATPPTDPRGPRDPRDHSRDPRDTRGQDSSSGRPDRPPGGRDYAGNLPGDRGGRNRTDNTPTRRGDPRDSRDTRDSRDNRSGRESRDPRDAPAGPASSNAPPTGPASSIPQKRPDVVAPEVAINPERARLIQDDNKDRSRSGAGTSTPSGGRTQSPRVGGDRRAQPSANEPAQANDRGRGRDGDRDGRDRGGDRGEGREGRDNRDNRDRDGREGRRDGRDGHDGRESREGREGRDRERGRDRDRERDDRHGRLAPPTAPTQPREAAAAEPARDARPERERSDRDGRGSERSSGRDRSDRNDRSERSDRGERSERERGDRERGDRERGDRERGERERERSDRSDRGDRGDRGDRDRGERNRPAPPQDPSYGRLNAIPSVADANSLPLGPRGSRGRDGPRDDPRDGGRQSQQQQSQPSQQSQQSQGSNAGDNQQNQPPSGPSRSSRRGRGGQLDGAGSGGSGGGGGGRQSSGLPQPPSAPSTSVNATPVSGDRMRQFNNSSNSRGTPPPPPPPPPPGGHSSSAPANSGTPDRSGQQHQPLRGQASSGRNLPHTPASSSNNNSGGRELRGGPDGGSSVNTPSSSNRDNNPGWMIKNIQSAIADGPGSGSRSRNGGNSGRGHLAGSDAQVLTGGGMPSPSPAFERNDPLRSNGGGADGGNSNGGRSSRQSNGGGGSERRNDRGDRSDRDRRSSHRGTHDQSPGGGGGGGHRSDRGGSQLQQQQQQQQHHGLPPAPPPPPPGPPPGLPPMPQQQNSFGGSNSRRSSNRAGDSFSGPNREPMGPRHSGGGNDFPRGGNSRGGGGGGGGNSGGGRSGRGDDSRKRRSGEDLIPHDREKKQRR